jgi:hypothetical protein
VSCAPLIRPPYPTRSAGTLHLKRFQPTASRRTFAYPTLVPIEQTRFSARTVRPTCLVDHKLRVRNGDGSGLYEPGLPRAETGRAGPLIRAVVGVVSGDLGRNGDRNGNLRARSARSVWINIAGYIGICRLKQFFSPRRRTTAILMATSWTAISSSQRIKTYGADDSTPCTVGIRCPQA